MSSDQHLLFHAELDGIQSAIWKLGTLFTQPASCPADKVGRKNGELFLQKDGWGGANLQMVHGEHIFTFFYASFSPRLWLAKGDLARAGEWADRMVINQPQNFLQEWGWITCARVRLVQGRYREAQDILETLEGLPGSASRILRQIRAGLLLSIVLFCQNKLTEALQTLEACLDLTEPGNFLRVFLDSGKPMRELLSIYLQTSTPTHKAYVQKLLAVFHGLSGRSIAEKAQTDLVEPLTLRELEVLRLLATGCSNRQIAETLVIAEGTVKFYVHAVLAKLEVHSRTQAIAKARELNLV